MSKGFSCKLNQKYKDALKYKPKSDVIDDLKIAKYYGYQSVNQMITSGSGDQPIEWWRTMYKDDLWTEDDDNYFDGGNMLCCGLNELICGDGIDRDTQENRHKLAVRIQNIYNHDNRVFITGLPISKVGGGDSDYNFKNYRVIRKILLDFGMKQVTPRTYVNANSNNRLAVLVGQF